ncbi:MAG: hypothetical protein ABIE42_00025 [Candidatus Eisenbacteria bacterium]
MLRDGGTIVVLLRDAKGIELKLSIDRKIRWDAGALARAVADSTTYGRMFIDGKLVPKCGTEERLVLRVLRNWYQRTEVTHSVWRRPADSEARRHVARTAIEFVERECEPSN